jgi:hypothetical protein
MGGGSPGSGMGEPVAQCSFQVPEYCTLHSYCLIGGMHTCVPITYGHHTYIQCCICLCFTGEVDEIYAGSAVRTCRIKSMLPAVAYIV